MSKRCPECHHVNDDTRIFCSACGAALDSNIRLIQDLEKQKKAPAKQEPKPQKSEVNVRSTASEETPEKKGSPLPWIILGLAAVAAVVVWLVLF